MIVVESKKPGDKTVKILGPVNGGTRISWDRYHNRADINGKGHERNSAATGVKTTRTLTARAMLDSPIPLGATLTHRRMDCGPLSIFDHHARSPVQLITHCKLITHCQYPKHAHPLVVSARVPTPGVLEESFSARLTLPNVRRPLFKHVCWLVLMVLGWQPSARHKRCQGIFLGITGIAN